MNTNDHGFYNTEFRNRSTTDKHVANDDEEYVDVFKTNY